MKIIRKLVLFFMVFVVVLQLSEIDIAAKTIAPYPRLSELYFIDITSYPDEKSEVGIKETLPHSSSYGLADRNIKAK